MESMIEIVRERAYSTRAPSSRGSSASEVESSASVEGLKAIKEAMWKVDGSGGLEFSDATDPNQLTLFTPEPDFSQLKRLILERFSAAGPVSVDDIEQFVLVETPFRETHYKLQILKQMEKVGELEVTESPRRRPLSYPAGTLVGSVRSQGSGTDGTWRFSGAGWGPTPSASPGSGTASAG